MILLFILISIVSYHEPLLLLVVPEGSSWHLSWNILFRFLILQVFLMPLTSSFVKTHPQGSLAVWDLPSGYILDPNAVATVAALYAAASPFLVIVISLMTSWRSLFSMLTLVRQCLHAFNL